jgi:hypothetical protein
MTKIIMTKYQLMCFLPALGKGISTQPNSGINRGRSKDPDEKALATKFAALIGCFRTVSLPALIPALIIGLTIKHADIRYSTYEPLILALCAP